MRVCGKPSPLCDSPEPPQPHGFIFASVHHGFPMMFMSYRFPDDISYHLPCDISYHLPCDISYRFRMVNRQGLLPPALLSVDLPQLVRCHAALPC